MTDDRLFAILVILAFLVLVGCLIYDGRDFRDSDR